MKRKSHSGAKKRVKLKGKKKIFLQKSAKNHLLTNKSKRQKAAYPHGMPADPTNVKKIRRMLAF